MLAADRRPEPPRLPRSPGGTALAIVAWIIILAACANVFIGNNLPEPPPAAPEPLSAAAAEKLPPPGMLDPLARVLMGAAKEERAAGFGSIKAFAHGPAASLRVAMLEAEVATAAQTPPPATQAPPDSGSSLDAEPRPPAPADLNAAALKTLDEIPPLPEGSILATETALVRRLIVDGAASLSDAEKERIRTNHGFIGRLALTRGLPDTDDQRKKLLDEANTTTMRMGLIGGGTILLGIFMILGCVGTGIIFLALGKVRPSLQRPIPGGSVFVETFAVFLLAMLILHLASPLLRGLPSPLPLLAQWLVAPTVFWPLLRGMAWKDVKDAMGWHTGRGFFREVGAGVVGYLACAPVVAMGIVGTLLLAVLRTLITQAEGEPPTHPIGALLANADIWMLLAVASLAVMWAPLVEESMFRGALYHHLRGRWHWLLAGPAQAFLFAAIHPQGWIAIPALGSIGLSFSLLREWRTSLIPGITAHAMNNGTIVLLLVVLSSL